ncbi:MAG: hypothetical protein R6V38_08615 [Roseovarius gahaiensis]
MAKIQTVLLAHIFRCKQTSPASVEWSILIFLLHCNDFLTPVLEYSKTCRFQGGHLPEDARAVKVNYSSFSQNSAESASACLPSSDSFALKTYLLTQAGGKASVCWEQAVVAAASRLEAASFWPRKPAGGVRVKPLQIVKTSQ